MAEEQSGFLGRWSRRKTDVLQGKAVADPVVPTEVKSRPVAPVEAAKEVDLAQAEASPAPVLSLEDVKVLTKDSDFKPFMAPTVNPDVRNAAMKKLFADPHFNVMDGLDIYIDDYSKSDPIPEAMLRAMTSSKFLRLFDDKEDLEVPGGEPVPRENANMPEDQTVAQSSESTTAAEPDATPHLNSSQPELLPDGSNLVASQKDHDHPDLRLQPDHATPESETGRGTQ